jgi:hypothetical protein
MDFSCIPINLPQCVHIIALTCGGPSCTGSRTISSKWKVLLEQWVSVHLNIPRLSEVVS